MKQSLNTTKLSVKNNIVKVIQIGEIEYISLTDLAKYADKNNSRYPIQNWMRTKDVILYLGLWENFIIKILNVSNSTRLRKMQEVIKFKISHKNGLKKRMRLV